MNKEQGTKSAAMRSNLSALQPFNISTKFTYIRSAKNALLLIFTAFILQSCQEVVDIKLKDADKVLVVEGSITDQILPDTINLTKTVNFSETNNFPAVSNAEVTMSNSLGQTEILTEVAPGKYINQKWRGEPGATYTLFIKYEGKEYVATSTMPATKVSIDQLFMAPSPFGDELQLNAVFRDPAGEKNFYRIQVWKNDTLINTSIGDDQLQDGEEIQIPLFSGRNRAYRSGDSVMVSLQCLDKNVYEYFRTLDEVTGGGMQAASPANPRSNVSNGALGYFSAHSVKKSTFIVP